MALLISVVAFILVFVCTLIALRQIDGFSSGARWLVAACTAILSVLGLISHCGAGPSPVGPDLAGVLLPYAALGATLIVLLILLLIASLCRARRHAPRRSPQRDERAGCSSEGHVTTRRQPSGRDRLDRRRLP